MPLVMVKLVEGPARDTELVRRRARSKNLVTAPHWDFAPRAIDLAAETSAA
jgi:hypothetical protein